MRKFDAKKNINAFALVALGIALVTGCDEYDSAAKLKLEANALDKMFNYYGYSFEPNSMIATFDLDAEGKIVPGVEKEKKQIAYRVLLLYPCGAKIVVTRPNDFVEITYIPSRKDNPTIDVMQIPKISTSLNAGDTSVFSKYLTVTDSGPETPKLDPEKIVEVSIRGVSKTNKENSPEIFRMFFDRSNHSNFEVIMPNNGRLIISQSEGKYYIKDSCLANKNWQLGSLTLPGGVSYGSLRLM